MTRHARFVLAIGMVLFLALLPERAEALGGFYAIGGEAEPNDAAAPQDGSSVPTSDRALRKDKGSAGQKSGGGGSCSPCATARGDENARGLLLVIAGAIVLTLRRRKQSAR